MTDETQEQAPEVGKGKPPKEHQFKPGQSGNLRGRPKGSKNFKTEVRDILKSRVPLKENGRLKKTSTQKAALLRLREKALGGDARSLERLLTLARDYDEDELAETARSELAPKSQAILDRYFDRRQRREAAISEGRSDTDQVARDELEVSDDERD